jgi:hypothetical protein
LATNRQLKDDLLARLNVTERRLGQLAQERKRQLPMGTEQAVYTIAHEHGVDVSKYLSHEEVGEVRRLVADLRAGRGPAPAVTIMRTRKTPRAREDVKVKVGGGGFEAIPALKKSHAEDAKRMSERVYPMLYLFENSVRDLIEAVLRDNHGKDWWTKAVPARVRETAAKHKADEARDAWHSKRGQREIDYILLNELWAIINHRWSDFSHLFPGKAWVESLITNDMNVSRRVIAHMNPLGAEDVRNIEAAFSKWRRQLQAVHDKIP